MEVVDGQFDDVDDNYELNGLRKELISDEIKAYSLTEEKDYDDNNGDYDDEDDYEDDDDDTALQSVEWNTSNTTRQYMQFVGKVSSGTNPQSKSFHESAMKKYQNNLNLDAYNPLISKSFRKADDHISKNKDKSDHATVEKALDKKTTMILFKMLNRVYTGIDGCISTGKEANVYHATSVDKGRSLAVKVFKTVGSEFRNRDQYMAGEYRFRFNTCTKDIRKLVPRWAEKEFRNLNRIYKAAIPSPEPICINNNVLVMEFLGQDGRPAPKLKDVTLSSKQSKMFYEDCIKMMRIMFQECKLVHADLSEFNLLVMDGKLFMIDVSQSVEMDNDNAIKFLKMDIKNVTMYFRKQGVTTLTFKKLMEFIMNPDIKDKDDFIKFAIEDAAAGEDIDEEDVEHLDMSKTFGEYESCGKDLRNIDNKRILHVPMNFSKASDAHNDDDDDDNEEDEGEDDEEEVNNVEENVSKDKSDQIMYSRPRNETADSRKERKQIIKDIQRVNRQNKIPKADKKRRCKVSKNKKS